MKKIREMIWQPPIWALLDFSTQAEACGYKNRNYGTVYQGRGNSVVIF